MARIAARVLVGFGLWFVVLPIMTLTMGVPAALRIVTVESKGGLLLFAGWAGGSWAGLLGDFGGPLGMPAPVFWSGSAVFGGWFAVRFVMLGRAAWGHALTVSRLMNRYGMPPSEIV